MFNGALLSEWRRTSEDGLWPSRDLGLGSRFLGFLLFLEKDCAKSSEDSCGNSKDHEKRGPGDCSICELSSAEHENHGR